MGNVCDCELLSKPGDFKKSSLRNSFKEDSPKKGHGNLNYYQPENRMEASDEKIELFIKCLIEKGGPYNLQARCFMINGSNSV